MTSNKKIAANRKNALKSTGPKTALGKSHSRLNAIQSGLHTTARLIRGEDELEYFMLEEQMMNELAPENLIQKLWVDQIIGDVWRLKRVEKAERSFLQAMQDLEISEFIEELKDDDRNAWARVLGQKRSQFAGEIAKLGLTIGPKNAPRDARTDEALQPGDQQIYEAVTGALNELTDVGAVLGKASARVGQQRTLQVIEHRRSSLEKSIVRKLAELRVLQGHPL